MSFMHQLCINGTAFQVSSCSSSQVSGWPSFTTPSDPWGFSWSSTSQLGNLKVQIKDSAERNNDAVTEFILFQTYPLSD